MAKIKDLPKVDRQREKLEKVCACCGKEMNVSLYQDGRYRGGHYFGKILLRTKQEIKNIPMTSVVNKNLPSREYAEYWECPKCYWN